MSRENAPMGDVNNSPIFQEESGASRDAEQTLQEQNAQQREPPQQSFQTPSHQHNFQQPASRVPAIQQETSQAGPSLSDFPPELVRQVMALLRMENNQQPQQLPPAPHQQQQQQPQQFPSPRPYQQFPSAPFQQQQYPPSIGAGNVYQSHQIPEDTHNRHWYPPYPQKKISKWPEWDGNAESFSTHLFLLRAKIEEDNQFLGSARAICLEIFGSVPASKQPRIAHWIKTGGSGGVHDWDEFLKYLAEQFEDKQAKQAAGDLLGRMRMGATQYFVDFLQDYEFRLSQCDGLGWADGLKIIHLNIGINSTLRDKLVTKSLPDDDYVKWIKKVKDVSGRLESLSTYRQKGSTQTKTWFLSQNGAKSQLPHDNKVTSSPVPKLDAQGDTQMSGVNALVTALVNAVNTTNQQGKTSGSQFSSDKPRAPWRTSEEFQKLVDAGLCIRCEKSGHIGPKCRSMRGAIKPTSVSNVKSKKKSSNQPTEEDNFSDSSVTDESEN